MIVHRPRELAAGYTPITELDGRHASMLMDFGILRLAAGAAERSGEAKERAFLLMRGSVELSWPGGSRRARRGSLLDEGPHVLHVSAGAEVTITAGEGGAELAVQKVRNPRAFDPVFYAPGDYRAERFGEGTLAGASTRIVRTVFDAANAPYSGMVLGEVVNSPGKWSSYPPHHHPQPEVYHFRFFPSGGFGYSEQGDEVFKVRDGDTALIPPEVTHPQTAAPGYAMWYLWMIPHLQEARFGPDSRIFEPEHEWLLDAKAPIWSEGGGA